MRTLQETKKDKIIIKGFFSNNFLGACTLCKNYKENILHAQKKQKHSEFIFSIVLCQ